MTPSRTHRLGNWLLLACLLSLLLVLDQGTKWLVVRNLAVNEAWAPIPALSRVFTITHIQNSGVAFGRLHGLGWIFMVVNLAVLIGVLVSYPRIPAGEWPLRVASALILTGDLGNVIDRLRSAWRYAQGGDSVWAALSQASVTDFMDFKIWPVFNVADMCIVSGVAIVAWFLWREERSRAASEPVTSG